VDSPVWPIKERRADRPGQPASARVVGASQWLRGTETRGPPARAVEKSLQSKTDGTSAALRCPR